MQLVEYVWQFYVVRSLYWTNTHFYNEYPLFLPISVVINKQLNYSNEMYKSNPTQSSLLSSQAYFAPTREKQRHRFTLFFCCVDKRPMQFVYREHPATQTNMLLTTSPPPHVEINLESVFKYPQSPQPVSLVVTVTYPLTFTQFVSPFGDYD